MFQDPVRHCLENHDIPEKEIESALKRVEDLTNSVLKMFDDFADFWKKGTAIAQRLKITERDRKKILSLRNLLEDLSRHPAYQVNAARLIDDINKREKAFKAAEKREEDRAKDTLRHFLGPDINATVRAKYINEAVVCLVEALTHLTLFDKKWIGLQNSEAFVLVSDFLNKHAPAHLPGSDTYDSEKIRSRYNKNKHKKVSIPHIS